MVNRLAQEKSPYLLQYASHPVDWYSWGDEAFKAAKLEDKPIFLSIGFSTCHWCHQMAQESFENPTIAHQMNQAFINIQVDREEHPEIEAVYMEFAQVLMSSAGGWPLNVILTPDLQPFFAITYLPAVNKNGLVGFPKLISHIHEMWQSDEKKLFSEEAKRLVEIFGHTANATGHYLPSKESSKNGIEQFFALADPVNGGLKSVPKFPLGYHSECLMAYAKLHLDSRALYYVDKTLTHMCRGGIYDHLAGGFSRYTVADDWVIPHFEKMLYDNAILAKTYLEAWKMTKNELYRKIATQTLEYLLRDMRHKEGGFFAAQDSDVEGKEGLYYTWTPAEILDVIPGEEGEILCGFFDVTYQGNFQGRNVLHIETSAEEFAPAMLLNKEEFLHKLDIWKQKLLEKRSLRAQLFTDKTILTSWNGLVIDALAKASSSFDEPKYLQAATQTAHFLKTHLCSGVSLYHRYVDGDVKFSATLEDYAYLIKGLLTLFEEGAGSEFLEWAISLTKIVEKDFKEEEGAFYQTDGKEALILRKCDFYDGAEPSGNGVHAENLLRLYQLTWDEAYLKQAEDILKASKNYIDTFAPAAFYNLMVLERYLNKEASTFIIALNDTHSNKDEIKKLLGSKFLPHTAIFWKDQQTLHPDKVAVNQQTTVYVCKQNKCLAPLTKLEEIEKVIKQV